MKFFDLFAGIGGFRLGMERNGHECIGSCEIDKYARQIYAKNFGSEPKYEDAKELKTEELPEFQCLCAGFPCQAFSLAGRRGGFEDTRGTLFFEIIRIARDKQPSILLLENVKGLLSHNKGKTYRTIIQALDEVGYDCEWQLLNSKYFVPQNRERIFIIGHLRGQGRREILPVGEVNIINKGTQGKTSKEGKRVRSRHSRTLDANYWKGGSHGSLIAEPKLKKVAVIGKDDQAHRVYSSDGIASNLNALGGGLGAKTGLYTDKTKMVYTSNTNANMKQRVQFRDATWTLTGNGSDFGLIDGRRIRRLTPKECERLQGFPDGYTEKISDRQRYKCLGNAVTVNVIQYIGSFLKWHS